MTPSLSIPLLPFLRPNPPQTLKALLSLPPGFEQTDASLSSLITAASRRMGPRPYGYRPEEEDDDEAYDDDDDGDGDEEGGRWCSVS